MEESRYTDSMLSIKGDEPVTPCSPPMRERKNNRHNEATRLTTGLQRNPMGWSPKWRQK